VALEIRRRFADASVVLIEKEPAVGLHASGRNSGVLHAGFYYPADSLKARLCREGNREMAAYCRQRGLPLNPCGKLVVARGPDDLEGLDELRRRGQANGVPLESLTADEARRIEPRAKTYERALFSPTTASVDPRAVMASLADDLRRAGGRLLLGVRYLGREGAAVWTSAGRMSPGYLINAAGLYADRVARDFGFAQRYRILPFKGVYLCGDPGREVLRAHVYPVPDLAYPFLGVHFTLTVGGEVKIGPTAIPALWREQYRGLERMDLAECWEILRREAAFFLRNDFGFRTLARREIPKYSRRRLLALASRLVSGVEPARYRRWGTPGIRAQLVDLEQRRLEMDFRLEGDQRSLHVLNAVSPAFTCAFPFARYVVDQVERLQQAGRPTAVPLAGG